MRKIMHWVMIVAIISSTCVLTSCSNNDREADIVKIQGGKWDPQVRNALNELLDKAAKGSYAVFDFDKTSIVHDITNDSQYKQPIKEGKVDCIQAYMAPAYGNAVPVLVAGDSNGDVAMLTAFPDMCHGLIIDVGRSAESAIGKLAAQAKEESNKGRYLLQSSFEHE